MKILTTDNHYSEYRKIHKVVDTETSACVIPNFIHPNKKNEIKKWFEKQEGPAGLYRYCGKNEHKVFGSPWHDVIEYVDEIRTKVKTTKRMASSHPFYNVVSVVAGLAALDMGGELIYADGTVGYMVESFNNFQIDTAVVAGFEVEVAEKISEQDLLYLKNTLILADTKNPKYFSGTKPIFIKNCCTEWRQSGIWLGDNK